MKRSGFKPKAPPPRPVKTIEGYTPRPRPVPRVAALICVSPEVFADLKRADTRARMVVPVPKPEKAKPGKRTPTAEERAWMDAITALGCIACLIDGHPGTPGAVHHILRGGRRIGHLHSICLCDPGHHQGGQPLGVISRHPWKARFEARYGAESELLARSRALVSNKSPNRSNPAAFTEGAHRGHKEKRTPHDPRQEVGTADEEGQGLLT